MSCEAEAMMRFHNRLGHRFLYRALLTVGMLLTGQGAYPQSPSVQQQGSVIGDEVLYSIGGGRA